MKSDNELIKEFNFNRIDGLGTPVWGIQGITDKTDRMDLKEQIKAFNLALFNDAETGHKLSLEHKSKNGYKLFKSKSAQKISQILLSEKLLKSITSSLKESDSVFKALLKNEHTVLKPISMKCLDPRDKETAEISNRAWSIDFKNRRKKNYSPMEIAKYYGDAFNCIPFVPRMQFSVMRRGCTIPPHTDVSNKIATLMIYLPGNEFEGNEDLGTTFWKPKNKYLTNKQSESKFITYKDMEEFKKMYSPMRTKFQGNECIMFFRSNDSWHSFEHDSNIVQNRYSININLLYPVGEDT